MVQRNILNLKELLWAGCFKYLAAVERDLGQQGFAHRVSLGEVHPDAVCDNGAFVFSVVRQLSGAGKLRQPDGREEPERCRDQQQSCQ